MFLVRFAHILERDDYGKNVEWSNFINLRRGGRFAGSGQRSASSKLKAFEVFNKKDGDGPSGLIADSAGNFYGETSNGGKSTACSLGCGTIFKLAPPVAGKKAWKETVLFSFNGTNGSGPLGGLISDSAGNLYGTTYGGGASGVGTVFKLAPPAAGQTAWTQTVLFSFDTSNGNYNYPDGANPAYGVIADSAGNLYGTTYQGGASPDCIAAGCGTIFEVSPPGPGQTTWTETVLVSLSAANNLRIVGPSSGLIADSAGNFYGETGIGGTSRACNGSPCGGVFEVSPPAAGQTEWTATLIHSFDNADGAGPTGGLLLDRAGNLYGTTNGGKHSLGTALGTAFELTPPAAGQADWTLTTLVDFRLSKGAIPVASLIADSAGNLYGTTREGGNTKECPDYGCGVVFKLVPPGSGQTTWTETVLGVLDGTSGNAPRAGLIADSSGNLYGSASSGGNQKACPGGGCGTIFKVTQ